MADNEKTCKGFSRRSFLKRVGVVGGAGLLAAAPSSPGQEEPSPDEGITVYPSGGSEVELRINGKPERLAVKSSDTLLTVLREKVGLTGSKEVCDRGACGACTVLLNGRSVNSCMVLALDAVGAEVVTVEGLAKGDKLHPIQEAFVRHDACQCGYCIPGFVVRSKALLDENPLATSQDIRKGLTGNICRCAAYQNIFKAVESVSKGARP